MEHDRSPSVWRALQYPIAVGIAVAVTAWIGITLTRESGRVASIWLANGLLLGFLLSLPKPQWLKYLLTGYAGNLGANLLNGDALDLALVLSACNTLEVWIAASALHPRLKPTDPLTTQQELKSFILWGGAVAPLTSAICAGLVLSSQSISSVWDIVQIWYPADALGIFIVTPLVLVFKIQGTGLRHRHPELVAMIAILGAVTFGVFAQDRYPLLFLAYPPLFFLVFRHGQIGAAAGVTLITVIATIMTVRNHGPLSMIAAESLRERILVLQIFLAVASLLAYGISVMLAQRERLEHSIRLNLAEIEQIYRHTPVGLFSFDRELRFLRINNQMAEINGVAVEAHLGRNIREVVPQLADQITALADPVLRDGTPLINMEVHGRTSRAPDTDRDWIVNYHPLRTHEGEIVGLFGAVLEITDRKNAERELARRVQQLEALNQEMERFGYVVSHDLQSPLRNISSFAGLIERRLEGKLTDYERGLLGEISNCAKDMRSMVQDLLNLSRINSRQAQFASVNAEGVCAAAIHHLKSDIQTANAQVDYANLPTLIGDKLMLTQLFQNLISNGIKFQRPGARPHVVISAQKQGAHWQFRCTDNGIGIEAAALPRLFQIFHRINAETYPGTGIGLAICKRVVDIHGGRMQVESEVGRGTTFLFTIPVDAHIVDAVTGRAPA